MCGIFGAIGRDLPASALDSVLETLAHRGPDDHGIFIDKSAQVTLAHTRLAVIDLVTGTQPMHSADGNIVLVCNGEIYGFERIRGSLEAKGHHFSTKSDSEVIIYLYQEHGLDCFEHLRGEFAFLLYDRGRRLLVAARDRFGIKPLYFSHFPGGLVFASEMKAIFASGLVPAKLDSAGLDPLLDLDPKRARFPFEGIEHVPPASYLAIDLDSMQSSIRCYWSSEIPSVSAQPLRASGGKAPEEHARSVFRELEEAVRLRLRADVPVGLYLSGGIDSAFVGALMKRNLESPLHSFSISFTTSERNEQQFTREAAGFLDAKHHELAVTRKMLWDNLQATLWATELPFATLAPVGKFLLSQEARRHVTVVLNGQGADEVFLGYRSFFAKALQETHSPSGNLEVDLRRRRLKLAGLTGWLVQRLSLFLFHHSQRAHVAAARSSQLVAPPSPRPLINRVQEARIAEMPIDILGFLGDRVEMAHSLEVRVPFLDHRLYNVAKWIPAELKLRDGVEKAVLRDAARGVLPEDIRTRRKLGFMLTSDKIDFFGADRELTARFRPYLSRSTFERAQIFSWRAYMLVSLVARLPMSKQLPALKRMRRNANKLMMVMLQAHILHRLYVAEPPWASVQRQADNRRANAAPARELVS